MPIHFKSYPQNRYLLFGREPWGSEELFFGYDNPKSALDKLNAHKENTKGWCYFRIVDTESKKSTGSNVDMRDLVEYLESECKSIKEKCARIKRKGG